jgi:hypothetical protein
MKKKTPQNLRNSYEKTYVDSDKISQLLNLEPKITPADSDIITTLLTTGNEDDFQTFKKIITNEKIVFNSWFIANNFDISLLKNYCNNFEFKIQLALAEDPDVKLPPEIIKLIGETSSAQLALSRFFDLEENDKNLRELFDMIITESSDTGLGYFSFEDNSRNLLGGGALIPIIEDEEQTKTKKVDLALHIIDQNRGIGNLCLNMLFKKAFEEFNIDEIWSRSAKKDSEIINFMCKHGMIIKNDKKNRTQFYFIDKIMWEVLKN